VIGGGVATTVRRPPAAQVTFLFQGVAIPRRLEKRWTPRILSEKPDFGNIR
jgi:hypothetical protein